MSNDIYDFLIENYTVSALICTLLIILIWIIYRRRTKIHKGELLLIGQNPWLFVIFIVLYCSIMGISLTFSEWSPWKVSFLLLLGLSLLIAQVATSSNYIFKLTLQELIVSSMIMNKKVIAYSAINSIYLGKNRIRIRYQSNELFTLQVTLNSRDKNNIRAFLLKNNVCVEDE